ncbi:queuosine precursor transporter [Desulfurococcaceae archaeon MEX13E-LK6-19]|nr:queuosine precursor transporter [Desulfurococcaceae archaeon MEX13E-LK6-19]
MEYFDKKYAVLLGIFIASLTSSNYLAAKIALLGSINNIDLFVPAGVLAYAVTFTVTDVISEVYGKKAASTTVFIGFITQFFIIAYSLIAVLLPIAPFQEEYNTIFNRIFGVAPNIVVASLIAYLVSQNHDVWAFHWWKEKTHGRYLWLRNNASTIVSQFIDTLIFITLAFNVLPTITGGIAVPWSTIPFIILGQYLVKVSIALFDTPFVYLGVYILKGKIVFPKIILKTPIALRRE